MANFFDQFDGAPPAIGANVMPPPQASTSTSGPNIFDVFDGQPTAFGGSTTGGPDANSNPYAQFGFAGDQDAAPQGGAHSDASGANPYAQFGPSPVDVAAKQNEGLATMGSVAKNFGTGLLAGIPNALSGAEKAVNPFEKVTDFLSDEGILPHIPTGGELIKRGMGLVGADPDNPDQLPQPQNAPERIARLGGEGVSGMLLMPEGAPESLLPRVGQMVKNSITGAGAGFGGGLAREVAPEPYKDLAGTLGSLAGGGVGLAAAETPSAIGSAARGAADWAAPMVAPYSTSVRQRLAGDVLSKAATDPDAAVNAINNAPGELVPGSSPTTFQLTGDPGLGQLERATATKNPDAFLTRRGDQNAARLDALTNIESGGDPAAVGSFFRDQLDQIDQQMQVAHDAAATNARSATEGIGGSQAPDVLGEQARSAIQNSLDTAKANEGALWRAVDPDKTMSVTAAPVKQTFQSIYGAMTPEASIGLAPVEKQIGDIVSGYGQTLPLQNLVDLRSAVSTAMRDVRSPLQFNAGAYGRLSQLRGAVDDAISDSVTQRAAQEQRAVQMGAMQPEDLMLERLRQEVSDYQRAKRAQLLGTSGGDSGGTLPGRARVFSGQVGAGDEAGRAAFGPQGGAQSQGTFLDQATADRLKAATSATAERKQTFGAAPVSKILQRPGNTMPYTLPAGGVSSASWKAGAGGADAINAIVKASPEAIGPLKDMAAASLRSKAQDGILTSKQLDVWKTQHAPALAALEKASPGATAPFENAAKAGDHLATIAQQRKDTLAAVERSAVGKLLKIDDPSDAVKTIGSIFNRADAVKTMRGLAQAAAKDPAAMQGLRRAIVEHMESRLISNTEAGTSGQNLIKSDAFQTFLGKNGPALRQVFSDQEVGSMRAIAQDLKRANRSIAGSKLPGQSNTAQDTYGAHKGEQSLMSNIFTHTLGTGAGLALDHSLTGGLAGAVGSHVVYALRSAGIRSVDDLVKDAMLDPEIAKALLMKAPKRPDTGSAVTLASKLRRVAAFSAVQNNRQQP